VEEDRAWLSIEEHILAEGLGQGRVGGLPKDFSGFQRTWVTRVTGFGKLVRQKRKARTGFNPKTQQKIKIPAKTVVKFRVAKAAKDGVLGVKK